MPHNRPGAGPALATIKSITVWLEDENGVRRPTTYDGPRCIVGGVQQGIPVARVLDDAGDLVDFIGVAMRIIQGPPSGLVAPDSGGRIVPPT